MTLRRALLAVSAAALCLGVPLYVWAQNRDNLPPGVTSLKDLAYVTNGHPQQKLDLYLPPKSDQPAPVLVWIHGGGWRAGTKKGSPGMGALAKGYAVASIEYRFSQHAIFPAQIEDCKAAIRWLRAHAAEYNLDVNKFGAWGASAGGHLVALLGTSSEVKSFDVGENLDQSSKVQAVCDFFGPTDFVSFAKMPDYQKRQHPDSPEHLLLGGEVYDKLELAALASPVTQVSKRTAPFLIVHGDKDSVVPVQQSELLHERLKKEGISSHLHIIKNGGHGGAGFATPEVMGMIFNFFETQLKSPKPPVEALETESTVDPAEVEKAKQRYQEQQRKGPMWQNLVSQYDKDGDGKISKSEFDGNPATFNSVDGNGDGIVTKEEFDAALARRQQGQ